MGDAAQDEAGDQQRPAVPDELKPEAPEPKGHHDADDAAASDAGAPDVRDDDAHDLPDEVEYPGTGSGLPPRVERWRRRSATGAMLTGFAMGLREVLETEQREPAIVMETSGVPPRDLAVEADLDNLPPRQSVVKVRRWLLTDTVEPSANVDEAGADVDEPSTAADGAGAVVAPSVPSTEIRKRARPRSRASRFFGGKGS